MTQHCENNHITHNFLSSQKYCQPLISLSDNTLLILIILLIADALANPYAGLIYDARLYAVQALSRLNPGVFSKDLFFMFGSQDSFSFFSLIHSWFIGMFDLYFGSWILYQIIRVIFYIAVLLFFRTLLDNNFLAFICALLIAAGPAHYIAFDVNDPFLTPRLLSVAIALLGTTKILKNDTMSGILLIALAGLFHPLMTIAPGILVLFHWFYLRKYREIAILFAGGLICFLLIVLFKNNPFEHIDIFATLDEQWRRIIIEDGSCVVPGKWCQTDRTALIGSLLICACSVRSLPDKLQKITCFLVIITVFGIILTVLSVYWFSWILPVQFQFWRAFWLLRLIIPAICLFWAFHIWKESKGYILLAVPLLVIAMFAESGVTAVTFPWVVLACCIVMLHYLFQHSFFKKTFANRQNIPSNNIKTDNFIKKVLAIEILSVFLLIICIVIQQTGFIETTSVHAFLFSFTAVLAPLFRPFLLIALCFFAYYIKQKENIGVLLLIPVFFSLIVPGRVPFYNYPAIIKIDRPAPVNDAIGKKLNTWQRFIAPGSVIYTDGAVPVDLIWFHLGACGYVSRMQKGGIVFNRDLAIEFYKRKQENILFHQLNKREEIFHWSRKNKIDYIITSKVLPLVRLGQLHNVSLYSAK